ncbi:MAG: sporulation protein YtfJ [Oscillospiraceae bacterium]|nr:sporulation protein YtfJ [Oscillospiraceae bacterium]MBR4102231.1 sporulation protein YtfJ [Oscillospiraceae bacterium]MBR6617981.1 sporulation protein YtfJ [Oscillospiraceae bacterium]
MSEHAINGFMGISMEKIRSVVDANTMIGDPIQCGDGTTVIPVSKVSLGFASGGSDIPTRTAKEYFAGGAGAGMSVKPVGFLVVQNGDVRLVQLSMSADKGNVALNMIPEIIDKISALLPKKDKKSADDAEAVEAEEVIE